MSKRQRLSKRGSRRLFKSTATKTKAINVNDSVMRGGIRL